MEHPRVRMHKLLYRLRRHFQENRETRVQSALLALFFALLAWTAGVLVGAVAAFFVVFLLADGTTHTWPALYVLIGTTLLVGIAGSIKAWRMYQSRIADA